MFHLKNFENLLYDSINLLYMSHDVDLDVDHHDLQGAFSRGSIINTLLLFECAANCCIDVLKLSGQLYDDIEKLPFLTKFELFLNKTNPLMSFDRGSAVVAGAAELKSLRDKYVHAKVKKKPLTQTSLGQYEVDFNKTALLGIAYDPSSWQSSEAAVAARAANAFFNTFFLEWCKSDSDTVCGILLDSSEATIPGNASVLIDCIGGLDRAVKDFKVDFLYIGKEA